MAPGKKDPQDIIKAIFDDLASNDLMITRLNLSRFRINLRTF
ncbi:MAG TPA: hypothetical protein VKM55_10220 [Candidatus Lokiarchaeia archaeon]|nr:hypothetical protein [Candidatus Lokiarchaeia archaeon]